MNRHLRDAVGGSELQCDLVARGLTARGHEVVYLALGGAVPKADEDAAALPLPYVVVPVPAEAGRIAAACLERKPDAVYWRHGRRFLAPVVRVLRRSAIPVVLAVAHADDVARWPARGWPWGFRDRLADARARLRHRASYRVLRRVSGVASQRADQLATIPVRPVRLVRNIVMAPELPPEPHLNPRPYVAWVGNLKPRKRPEVCLLLADALAPLGVDVLMAGAVQDPAYAGLARPDPARPNLRHLGPLAAEKVAALIAGAVCVAVTYRPEGFSNVLLQAWALGRATPSLGYDPDGLIAAHGLGGVAGEDVDLFVAMVADLVMDPIAAAAAGQRARSVVRDGFDPTAAVDALEALMADVIAHGPGSRSDLTKA